MHNFSSKTPITSGLHLDVAHTCMMKPYAQRQMTKDRRGFKYILIFLNNKLSMGWRIVESAFGILAQRSKILDPHYDAKRSHYNRYHRKNLASCTILHNLVC